MTISLIQPCFSKPLRLYHQELRIFLLPCYGCDIFGDVQKSEKPVKAISTNRKAHHLYHILESYEAGVALVGTEVKSLRLGGANLKDSYAMVEKGEIYLRNMHISPYDQASRFNHDPTRTRKLLMHKKEIKRLLGKTVEKGLTLVPLRLYFKGNVAKVELALVIGKKMYDRRKDIKDREVKRELRRALKEKQR